MRASYQHTAVEDRPDLQTIISPTPLGQFVAELWERETLHVRRGERGYFQSLFGLEDLDHLINTSFTNYGIYTIRGQEIVTPALRRPRKTMLGEFYGHFSSGRTIAVRDMQIRWAPIARLVSAIVRQSGFAITADLFAAPPRSRNIGAFESDRSLFVLQLGGSATWHVSGSELRPPADTRAEEATQGHAWSAMLGPGDTLYAAYAPGPGPSSAVALPEVETGDEHALYLVLAVERVTWADLAARAVEVASLGSVELRKALGFGAPLRLADAGRMETKFRALVSRALASPDWDAARTLLACEQKRRLPALPDGHFEQLRRIQHMDLDTVVERRPGVTGQLRMFDGLVEFILPGYRYQAPDKLYLALDFINEAARFQVKDIPGWYTDEERVITAKHLVALGILRIATPSTIAEPWQGSRAPEEPRT